MGLDFFYINIFFICGLLLVIVRLWPLLLLLAFIEVLWVSLMYIGALASLQYNDLYLIFLSTFLLCFSAVELVLGIGTLFLIYHGFRKDGAVLLWCN